MSRMPAGPIRFRLGIDAYTFVILLAGVLSMFAIAPEAFGKSQEDSATPPGTVPVVGHLVFSRTSKIATPVVGRIASLPVRVGDHVKKGEVVAEIDNQQLLALSLIHI